MNSTKLLFSVCDLLRRENSASRIAAGVALGFLIGFTPILTLQGLLYLTLALILRVNPAAILISLPAFTLLRWLLIPLLSLVGHWLLTDVSALSRFWTLCYHSPLLPLTRFNHTAVMGGLAMSLTLSFPLYWLTKLTVMVTGEKIGRLTRELLHDFSSGTSRLVRNYAQYKRQNPA